MSGFLMFCYYAIRLSQSTKYVVSKSAIFDLPLLSSPKTTQFMDGPLLLILFTIQMPYFCYAKFVKNKGRKDDKVAVLQECNFRFLANNISIRLFHVPLGAGHKRRRQLGGGRFKNWSKLPPDSTKKLSTWRRGVSKIQNNCRRRL